MTSTFRLEAADRDLFTLAVPALGALVAEPLYLLADTAVVARLGTEALAGLAAASAVLLFIHSAVLFLAYGTTARVARAIGSGDTTSAADLGVTGTWLGAALGAAFGILVAIAPEFLVSPFDTGPAATDAAVLYLRVSSAGLPAILISLAAVGLLRGQRDTRTPLAVAIVTSLVNLAIELVLIVGLDFGIGASAFATVIAQWGGACWYLSRVRRAARDAGASLAPSLDSARELAGDGRHLIVRTLALRIGLVAVTMAAARLGDVELAAHHVAFEIWSLLALVLDSLAIAAQTLTGEAVGRGDRAEARRLAWRTVAWSGLVGVATGAFVVAFRSPIARAFGDDPEVTSAVMGLLLAAALLQPLAGVVFGLDGVVIGASDLAFAGRAMVVAAIPLIVGAAIVAEMGAEVGWLWAAIGLWLLVRALPLLHRLRSDAWLPAETG